MFTESNTVEQMILDAVTTRGGMPSVRWCARMRRPRGRVAWRRAEAQRAGICLATPTVPRQRAT